MATRKAKTRTTSAKKKPSKPAAKRPAKSEPPRLFRLNIEVGDLDRAETFYGTLLGQRGRRQAGSRVYFQAGAVTLQIVDVSSGGRPQLAAKALYFAVGDLDEVFARAKTLQCLSQESVHGTPAGAMVVRPWGERSFYADDPWGNPLCFVEEGTIYAG